MLLLLILLPAGAGLLAFVIRRNTWHRALLVATGLVHAVLVGTAWVHHPAPALGGWLQLDAVGLVFLSIVSLLFLIVAGYAVGYLAGEAHDSHPDIVERGVLFSNAPEAVFTACLQLFLAAMTATTLSHHLGLLWVALEATTLASAPLIFFHRHHRSLEATWKYLLICSVGIALALLGNFALAVSQGDHHMPLVVGILTDNAKTLDPMWLKVAFLFFLVGYGTKMGLAPLHAWLPDAHSESPSLVSALLSGALLNCAFLGILRIDQICVAAGLAAFAQNLLLGFGLLSMGAAAVFLMGQTDYKRMLAYSSVEHMGILALGVGLGGAAAFGAMLHAVNHSITKALLFLASGNILAAYRTKSVADVRGLCRALPVSGVLWMAGFLAIVGMPPFGTFLSELTILKAALDAQRYGVAIAYLAALTLIFAALASAFLPMAQGQLEDVHAPLRESKRFIAPLVPLLVLMVLLGLYLPVGLDRLLHAAARLLGGV